MTKKVAIVTGAAGGIGAACAAEFAQRGAAVIVADIDEESAKRCADDIARAGGRAFGVGVDVAEEGDVEGMVDEAVSRYGRLDILHNNAAATADSQMDDDLVEMDVDVWDHALGVNLRGPMLGSKHAIPHMIRGGGGVIINTSSGSAVIGEPTRFAYGASKAGLNSMTRSIAARYGKQGIRCVAVSPGITMTPEGEAALSPTSWLQVMRRHHATPRLGTPKDVAKMVAFLASDDAGFITGSVHPVDGGSSSAAPYAAEMREFGSWIDLPREDGEHA